MAERVKKESNIKFYMLLGYSNFFCVMRPREGWYSVSVLKTTTTKNNNNNKRKQQKKKKKKKNKEKKNINMFLSVFKIQKILNVLHYFGKISHCTRKIFFLFLHESILCWYSSAPPWRVASDE